MSFQNFHFRVLAPYCLLPLLILLAAFFLPTRSIAQTHAPPPGLVSLEIFGRVLDTHGNGVANTELHVSINGTTLPAGHPGHHGEATAHKTEEDGTYQLKFWLPADKINGNSIVKIQSHKPNYKRSSYTIREHELTKSNKGYIAQASLQLERRAGPAFWISSTIFILAYILISFELLHRTIAAMLGATIMLIVSSTIGTLNPEYHILSYESAIKSIDMNVIFLLMGMMIIVGILKHTGIFQWCAYKCYQLARGNIMLLAIILMAFTAVASAFLDNVTTMLLLTPVTIEIAVSLRINPLALLIPEILASNIGGTATLIGDPPNIMIGSYAGLSFIDFVVNLAPVCLFVMVVLFGMSKLIYGKEYHRGKVEDIKKFTEQLREEYKITDRTLLSVGLIIMAMVIGLFLTHGIWHMEVSVAALFGAALLFTYGLLTDKVDLVQLIEKDIEWTTLLFFMFLFILVGGVEQAGLLDLVADWILALSHGNLVISICLILWVSAIMSAFVDNIPFTVTMLPIVAYLTQAIPGADSGVLWWALAFGACFGGNGTMIGASANVVTVGIAESAGYSIRFFDFMKVAFPYMIISVAIANVWLLLVY